MNQQKTEYLKKLVVPLSRTSEEPPLGTEPYFFLAGQGGHVMPFQPMANSIASRRRGFGILYPALVEPDRQFDSIPALAECMTEALVLHRPNGPYLLAGYSFGGMVAQAIARCLEDRGETVGLVMIDTFFKPFLPQRATPFRQFYRYWLQLTKQLSIDPVLPIAKEISTKRPSRYAESLEILRKKSIEATEFHKPLATSAPTVILRGEDPSNMRWRVRLPGDLGWSQVANVLDVVELEGHHLEIYSGEKAPKLGAQLATSVDWIEGVLDGSKNLRLSGPKAASGSAAIGVAR